MNIIPHKDRFTQVKFHQTGNKSRIPENKTWVRRKRTSKIQEQAFVLHSAGFNVFPQPYGRKGGYAWKRLQYTRLSATDEEFGLQNLFAGECNIAVMCGYTSGNLFVIDCETQDTFRYHITQLEKRGIPIWASVTARGGHIYLRAANGEVKNITDGVMHKAEIKGQRGYVLAPPSLHPSGVIYQWYRQEGETPPVIDVAQINWLRDVNGRPIQLETKPVVMLKHRPGWEIDEEIHTRKSHRRLTRKTRDYIQSGANIPEGSRNNRLFSAACDLNGNGYSYEQAERLLGTQALRSGLPQQEVNQTLGSAYSQPREPARPRNIHIKEKGNKYWQYALFYAIYRQEWHTRTGNTDRALLMALIERSRVSSNGKGVFRASIRELSSLARMGTATVQRSLKRLRSGETPIIFHCGQDRTSGASLWKFNHAVLKEGKAARLEMDTVPLPPHWLSYSVSIFNSDNAERGFLGHGGMFLYHFMLTCNRPLMPAEVAELSGLTVNQVKYGLAKLASFGLVSRVPDGWCVVEVDDEELSVHLGSQGLGEARRARYREERAVFVGRLLFEVRLRAEGYRYRRALSAQYLPGYVRCVAYSELSPEIRDDPLIQLGLELGGVVTRIHR